MSEQLIKYEIFHFDDDRPFIIKNIYENSRMHQKLSSHWHEEMEIVYIVNGGYTHYIDGVCVQAEGGRLIVTNSESVHNIVSDGILEDGTHIAIMLILSRNFLEENIPQYKSVYFTNTKHRCSSEIREIMWKLSECEEMEWTEYTYLYMKGLILQLFYHMSREGMSDRETLFGVNYLKNIERLKGVFSYVENHYSETIRQAEIAGKFYFTKEYFARYFKKSTGMTFMKYLTYYRVQKAQKDLMQTNKSVLEIALKNGFSDDRGLINAFKEVYHTTPLQYRKSVKGEIKSAK